MVGTNGRPINIQDMRDGPGDPGTSSSGARAAWLRLPPGRSGPVLAGRSVRR